MGTTMWMATAMVIFISAAESLTCNQCTIGVFGRCFFPDEVECHESTPNCYIGEAQFNATGFLKLHTRGCLDTNLCNETIRGGVHLGAGFTSTSSCCATNLCNGVSAMHTSLLPLPLSAALVAVVCSTWLS